MSSLHVLVSRIESVESHPALDRLDVITVRGNTTVATKGQWKPGDLCVYVPGDSLIPEALAEEWGVTKFTRDMGNGTRRVMPVHNFRGVSACGMVQSNPGDFDLIYCLEGADVSDILGITKYVQPEIPVKGNPLASAPGWFHKYTDIENINNYPGVLVPGEPVYLTEKIHGTNSRVGYSRESGFLVGSRTQVYAEGAGDMYSLPLSVPGVKDLLVALAGDSGTAILYGEIYGSKVQKGHGYGIQGRGGYKAFDLCVDGRYLSPQDFIVACACHDVPEVPGMPATWDQEFAMGAMTHGSTIHSDTILEGLVVQPVEPRLYAHKTHAGGFARCIFKCINPEYKTRKTGGTEFQ